MLLERGLAAIARPGQVKNAVTADHLVAAGYPAAGVGSGETQAMKLSAVNRCIEILSDSMAKLPSYIIHSSTRERVAHPLLPLLNTRPNEAMAPSVRKKLLEANRLIYGNAYDWIVRSPNTGHPVELIPVPAWLVEPWRDRAGRVWYTVTHPVTGAPMILPNEDVMHYKAYSQNGIKGIGVLRRASEVIGTARAAQLYDLSYYQRGGQPAGLLKTAADLGGNVTVTDPDGTKRTISKKERLREEWERTQAGPQNQHRIAVLDLSAEYQPITASNKDAQFVENKEVTIRDIARFFGVPLYKLQEGKQAFNSNEQNGIDYVVSTLHPIVTQYEEEQTWKLLRDSELAQGLEIRINMMAELKGDTASRGAWYRNLRETSAFSPNDIRALEDYPDVEGGDDLYASLNYVPLRTWARLSEQRNEGGNRDAGNT